MTPGKVESCPYSESAVFDYFLDTSEGRENAEMSQHLTTCANCREQFERFKATGKAIGENPGSVSAAALELPLSEPTQQIPDKIGGYGVLNQIDEGGMGSVWKARRTSDGKTVALKILFKRLTGDLQFIQRFFLEASIGVKLDHPNLVKCLEVGESAGCYFMAQEFIDGEDLGDILKVRSKLPEAQALAITAAAARGMTHAHEHGLIHRDIKPANLMLTRTGVVKVMDFGLARSNSEEDLRLTATGAVLGTPHYISPEQIESSDTLDARTDVYSLGITLFHMLTGRPPFIAKNMYDILTAHVKQAVPDPRTINPEISAETAKLVQWMCARDRNQRVPDMKRLTQSIAKVMGLPSGAGAPDIQLNELELLFEETTAAPSKHVEAPQKDELRLQDVSVQIPPPAAPARILNVKERAMRVLMIVASSAILLSLLWLAYYFVGRKH